MNTRTLDLWNEHRRQNAAQHAALDDVIREEFPPGTRVRWVHTFTRPGNVPVYREGVVSRFYGLGKVNVRVKPGGPEHCLYAYHLDLIG